MRLHAFHSGLKRAKKISVPISNITSLVLQIRSILQVKLKVIQKIENTNC